MMLPLDITRELLAVSQLAWLLVLKGFDGYNS